MFAARLLVCEGGGSAGVGFGGGVVAVSSYIGGTRGSGVLDSADDVLEISVVRGVGGVYDMCMCLTLGGVGGVGGEWVTGLGLGFTNSGVTWGKWDMWLCFGCGGVGGRLGPGSGRVGLCYVCVCCESGFSVLCRWQVQVYVYCARLIPAHLMCTQCSIPLQLIDICVLICICL